MNATDFPFKDNSMQFMIYCQEIKSVNVHNSSFYVNYANYDLESSLSDVKKKAEEILLRVQFIGIKEGMKREASQELHRFSLALNKIYLNAQKALGQSNRKFSNYQSKYSNSSMSELAESVKELSKAFQLYSFLCGDNTSEVLFALGKKLI